MQHFFNNRVHSFVSGMGESPNPKIRHMNNVLNPSTAFDYFTTCPGERFAMLMVEGSDEEMNFTVVSGIGNRHYKTTIRKKTPV